jgi:hypothetical protein
MPQNTATKEKVKFSEKKNVRVYAPATLKSTIDKKWSIICLPLLGFFLVAFGLALIIVGAVKNIEDLILLGCIFGAGSLIFFFLLYTSVCRPMCQRNVIETFDMVEKSHDLRPTSGKSSAEYYNAAFDPKEDLVNAKNKPQPTENDLYGEKMRSFLATPMTTSGVLLYSDSPDTPPPPRIALPSDPGDSKQSVFTMDVDDNLKDKSHDISQLELL